MRELRTLPKAELHIHIEGSLGASTLREWAERGGGTLPHGLRDDDGWRFDGSLDFIENYVEMCRLLTELDDFRRMGEEFCEDLAATGVRYAEAVFSPANHAARLSGDWFGPIEALLGGLDAGRRATGVTVGLCPDIVRDLGPEEAERTLEVALAFAGKGVVALNAAGSERAPVAPFGPMFRRAKDAGLGSVPHAGEWAGARNVWETLEHYAPDRIGHGVAAATDPRLMEHLAASGIPLEVSPLSNVATGVFATLEEHPFRTLRDAGVMVTLNSDDPSMFGAWLSDVYAAARDAWAFDDGTLAAIARDGVRASFADEVTKTALFTGIDAWLETQPEGEGSGPGVSAIVIDSM
ncbi:MAG: adenosine deaminase [Actinomycetota bacterium]